MTAFLILSDRPILKLLCSWSDKDITAGIIDQDHCNVMPGLHKKVTTAVTASSVKNSKTSCEVKVSSWLVLKRDQCDPDQSQETVLQCCFQYGLGFWLMDGKRIVITQIKHPPPRTNILTEYSVSVWYINHFNNSTKNTVILRWERNDTWYGVRKRDMESGR